MEDQQLSLLPDILDAANSRHTNDAPNGPTYILPFVNASYRAKVRVVDFEPHQLEDFAIQAETDDDASEFSMDLTWESSSLKWEWSFALQLEEVRASNDPEPARLWVNVGHTEAQFLLGNSIEEPSNLRTDPALLNKLREKLYILWGDLEEKKQQAEEDQTAKRQMLVEPSNKPFDCCIQEYGVLRNGCDPATVDDWKRQYMLHGVTIL